MIKGGKGGGKTTTGLTFENDTDILKSLALVDGYHVDGKVIYFNSIEVAKSFRKNDLYAYIASNNIYYKDYISKRLLPDDAIYIIKNKKLFIIEKKFQQVAGSVDEKLQTCDFKKKQYQKLMQPLNIEVEYVYVLNDCFRDEAYKDTLDYIESVGCYYFFNVIPLEFLELPIN